jgi:hypothetical protein
MRRCLKKNESVLLISPRKSFTASIGNGLVRAGLKVGVYLEARPDMLAPGQVSIISPQSLYKLGADELLGAQAKECGLLVLDECETTLQQMSPNTTQRTHLMSNWRQLIRLAKDAHRVIATDAYLSNRTTPFLANVRPAASSCLVLNEFKPEKGLALKLVGNVDHVRAAFTERLMQSVQAGKRVYVLCTERNFNDELKDSLVAAGVTVLQHTSENRNAASLGDVEGSWSLHQVVICTGGSSIKPEFLCLIELVICPRPAVASPRTGDSWLYLYPVLCMAAPKDQPLAKQLDQAHAIDSAFPSNSHRRLTLRDFACSLLMSILLGEKFFSPPPSPNKPLIKHQFSMLSTTSWF